MSSNISYDLLYRNVNEVDIFLDRVSFNDWFGSK